MRRFMGFAGLMSSISTYRLQHDDGRGVQSEAFVRLSLSSEKEQRGSALSLSHEQPEVGAQDPFSVHRRLSSTPVRPREAPHPLTRATIQTGSQLSGMFLAGLIMVTRTRNRLLRIQYIITTPLLRHISLQRHAAQDPRLVISPSQPQRLYSAYRRKAVYTPSLVFYLRPQITSFSS